MNRRIRLLSLLTAAALILSACARDAQSDAEGTSIVLPDPPEAPVEQILGDDSLNISREATLYCPSADSLDLTTVTRTIRAGQEESFLRAVLVELLEATPIGGALPVRPADALLEDVEFGCGVATVRLSLDAGVNRSDADYLLLCAAIANTLLDIDGVEAVNVLTGGRANFVSNLPLGAIAQKSENVAATYAQLQAETERFPGGDGAGIARSAVLYFPAQGGKYLLPEVRELAFSSEDYARTLIQALQAGPSARACSFSAVPGNQELLAADPELWVNGAGERVLELRFSSTLPNYLALAGVEPWQLYGSLVLTLCSFVPELDAVRVSIEELYVTECALPDGRRAQFADGLMRRSDFDFCTGSSAALYFAREDGSLARVECPLSQAEAASARGRLAAMIAQGDSWQAGLRSVFPEGIFPEDILGVSLEGRTATVNLSGNFYSRCQSLSAAGERALIYGMVNALCELDHVGAVAFRVEGAQLESLSQNIYLKTALMPDPGLVTEPAPESPEAEIEANEPEAEAAR